MATVFSLLGQGLKLDTRADIEPHLAKFDPAVIEEIHFGGNTVGVEAAQALAEFLTKTQKLRVRVSPLPRSSVAHAHIIRIPYTATICAHIPTLVTPNP